MYQKSVYGLKSFVASALLTLTPFISLNRDAESKLIERVEPFRYFLIERDFGRLIQPSRKAFFVTGKYFSEKSSLRERIEFYDGGNRIFPASEEGVKLNFGDNSRNLIIVKNTGSLDLYKRRQ